MTDRERNATPAVGQPPLGTGLEVGGPTAAIAPAARPRRAPIGLTADGRLKSGRLAGLSMNRAIWILSWPVLVESFLNSLVGLVDTVIAAHLPGGAGAPATSAIGGASVIMWFMGLIIMAISVGATALVSRSVGSGRMAVANAVLGQTMILAAVAGIALAFLISAAALPVARMMALSDQATDMFEAYMIIVAAGTPFTALLFAGIACARGAGDSARPLIAMVVVNAVNIVLSWALAGVPLTLPAWAGGATIASPFGLAMGVQGIAIGTLIAHAVGSAIILSMAIRGTWGIRLMRRRLRPHWHTMRRLVRLGIPNFAETAGLWVGNFLIVLVVGQLGREAGTELMGAHIVAVRIEAFSFMAGFAMGMAAATLAGQYLGAGSADMARRAVMRCALVAAGVMGTLGLAFIFLPGPITAILTDQAIHMKTTPTLIQIAGAVQIPFAFAIVYRAAMRGAGDVKAAMALTWITTYGVRLPLCYVLSGVDIALPGWLGGGAIENPFPFEGGLIWLWAAMCAELVVRGVVFAARFFHGGWTRAQV